MEGDEKARDHDLAEKINRIADFGIEAACNELPGLRRHRERASKLEARHEQQNQCRRGNCQPEPVGPIPRLRPKNHDRQ